MSWMPAPPSNPTCGLRTPLPSGVHSSMSLVCTQALVPTARRAPRWGSLSDPAPGPGPEHGPAHRAQAVTDGPGSLLQEEMGVQRGNRGGTAGRITPLRHTHTQLGA